MRVGHIILAAGMIAMIVGSEGKGGTFVMGLIWAVCGGISAVIDDYRRAP